MNAGKKSVRRIAANSGMEYWTVDAHLTLTSHPAYLSRDSICSSCLHSLSQQSRRYAAEAAAVAEPAPGPTPQHIPLVTATAREKAYSILVSPVISRPPLITRDLTDFEKAYYLYQKRLNERLALPFSRYFYAKKDTPADLEWKRKAKGRKSAARDIGQYSGYGDEAWNDEVLVGDKTAEPDSQREALLRDAEGRTIDDANLVGDKGADGEAVSGDARAGEGSRKDLELQVQRPAPRTTEADEKNDVKSLSRKLDTSLYLLLKNKEGRWRFPEGRLYSSETLNMVRSLQDEC
jgi:large subunit ribosomal protein L46